MTAPVAYPLTWPHHIERAAAREAGAFKTSLAGALANVEGSLTRFGKDSGKPVSDIVISSNVALGDQRPADPGVAVWFVWEGMQVCIPVDRYSSVAANLQAIHHVLEARRTELRHGTLALVRATFTGFKALPAAPPAPGRPWWEVMDLPRGATRAQMEARYRALALVLHPDKPGGSAEAMAELNAARETARIELGTEP